MRSNRAVKQTKCCYMGSAVERSRQEYNGVYVPRTMAELVFIESSQKRRKWKPTGSM